MLKKHISLISILLITLISAYFVMNRDINGLDDTFQYYNFFKNVISVDGSYQGRYEPLFSVIAQISRAFGAHYKTYFLILYLILIFLYYFSMYTLIDKRNLILSLFAIIFFLFISSWFIASSSNGLRQGLALGLLYISMIYYFVKGRKVVGLFVFVVSIGFHYSMLLILPFYFLFNVLNLGKSKVYFMLAVLYPLKVYESLLLFFSNITGVPIHRAIAEYGSDIEGYRNGFQLDLFLYTFIYYFIFKFLGKYIYQEYKKDFYNLINIYSLLTLAYYIYGFANYSNRFGYIAWALIPIMQSYLFVYLKIPIIMKFLILFLMVPFSLLFYISNVS